MLMSLSVKKEGIETLVLQVSLLAKEVGIETQVLQMSLPLMEVGIEIFSNKSKTTYEVVFAFNN